MNKRMRKKKHRGEFREFGFDFIIRHIPMDDDSLLAFHDKLFEMEERFQIYSGGGTDDDVYSGFMSASWRVDVERQKALFHAALTAMPEVTAVEFGENTDAWYGPFSD